MNPPHFLAKNSPPRQFPTGGSPDHFLGHRSSISQGVFLTPSSVRNRPFHFGFGTRLSADLLAASRGAYEGSPLETKGGSPDGLMTGGTEKRGHLPGEVEIHEMSVLPTLKR